MLTVIWRFLRLTRPVFLAGGALLYALGAALTATAGYPISWGRYALGQMMLTSIQLTTHYANEYFDLEGDRIVGASRTWFSGGSGVLADGRLSPRVAWIAARGCGLIAAATIAVTLWIEPPASAIGAVALMCGWFYSAPPLRLEASGFGEIVTALLVGFLSPLSAIVMQRGPIDARWVAIALPLMLINIAMVLTFEFPDFDADRQTGKRTLVVRLGQSRSAQLHNLLLASAFGVTWLAVAVGWIEARIAAWVLIGLPLAAWQVFYVARRSTRDRRGDWLLTAGGIALFALTSTSFLAGLLTT